jgi:Fe2+ transport system protein FeoA
MRAAQASLDDVSTLPALPRRGTMTRSGMSLADLKPGECGYITKLIGTTKGRLRLLEMGLTPGTHVQVTRIAAFGGPLDVSVRGYQLSLRRDEAAAVWLGDGDQEDAK